MKNRIVVAAVTALTLLLSPSVAQADGTSETRPLVDFQVSDGRLDWVALQQVDQWTLTLTTPAGRSVFELPFKGEGPTLNLEDIAQLLGDVPDGCYTWEVSGAQVIDSKTQDQLQELREAGRPMPNWLLDAAKSLVQSGSFLVENGRFLFDPDSKEETQKLEARLPEPSTDLEALELGTPTGGLDEQVISGDLTVYNSMCVGFDCLNSESYSFDTIRLKENNLRIHFDDTSTAGSYPRNDWRILVNDSTNGGLSRFSVEDSTANRIPFTLEAGAPANALYVDNGGRVGLGTSNPSVELQVVDGDSPTLRLEQDGSSGFQPQRWDVAGNETSFFIRDATNGSTLPFRIRPGAASNALVIDSDSDVGVGVLSPTDRLHVVDTTTPTNGQLYVQNTGATSERVMMLLENNGVVVYRFVNTAASDQWALRMQLDGFAINNANNPGTEFLILENGDINVNGVNVHSSRTLKEDFRPLDNDHVLQRVLDLPITEWKYKTDPANLRHIGPMAEDFHAAFNLNENDKNVSLTDVGGIALASIQALNAKIETKDDAIERLESENEELKARLERLEALVEAAAAGN